MSQLLTAEFISVAKTKLKVNPDKVNIESSIFRLFSRLTSSMLIVCCGLVTLQQLIGEHIRCITPPKEDVRPEALNQYCFIMSTYTLPHLYNSTVGVDVVHPGVGPHDQEQDTKYHAYYQWVPFVLFFQALAFLVPHFLWKSFEGGVLAAYCNMKLVDDIKLKQRALIDETSDKGLEKKTEKHKTLSRGAEFFVAHLTHNRAYAFMYVFCEILNFAIVVLMICATDAFLGYEFSTYGLEVANFLADDPENRMDPMNRVFPKVTKCNFHKFGPSGNLINYDVMCVLALNIINEKIYTFLWFWFIIMAILGGLALVYRLVVIFLSGFRNSILIHRVWSDDKDDLEAVLEKLEYADWFMLKQLSNNLNRIRFGELVHSIREILPPGQLFRYSSPASFKSETDSEPEMKKLIQ